MTDRTLFDLDAAGRYHLAYDSNQWIIHKRHGTRRKDAADGRKAGQGLWQAIWFIGGPKRGLWRSFRELEIILTDDAIARVDALPDDFLTWRTQVRQKEAVPVPARGGSQRDHAAEGSQTPESTEKPLDGPTGREKAA